MGEGGDRGHFALAEGPLDEGDGVIRGRTMGQEFLSQPLEGARGHEDCNGAPEGREFSPVQGLIQQVMTLEDTQLPAHAPVGEGDAGGRGCALEGTHTGNDLEGNAEGFEHLGLFPAPSVEQGVTTLEAHHPSARLGVPQQQLVNLGLGRAAATALAHRNSLGVCGEERLEGGFQQRIVEDDIRPLQSAQSSQGQQVWRTWTRPHQGDERGSERR